MGTNLILDSWQKEALEWKPSGNERYLLLCTGRQVGKTYIMSRKAAERMAERKTEILVSSLTEDQAKIIIMNILFYLETNHKKKIAKGKNKPTQNKIMLTNGSWVIARPVGTMGDSMRGFTGDVWIADELSRMNNMVIEACMPTLMTRGGEIWGCSTPFGKYVKNSAGAQEKTFFYKSFLNEASMWKVIQVTSEKVINERRICGSWTEEQRAESIRFLENQKKQMTANQYAQEYLGMFIEDLNRFFDDDLIKMRCILQRPQYKPAGAQYYAGHDLARMGGDYFTAEIIERISKTKFIHVESYSEKKLLTTRNEQLILDFNKTWNPKAIGIDAGAGTLGVSILDHLMQNAEVKRKLVAMNNREIKIGEKDGKDKMQRMFKEDMYDNLKSMMEHGEIDLLDDDKVRLSLASVQMERVKDSHENTKVRIFGTDTHIVEGIIRAAWLAKKEKKLNMFIDWI